ncbi:protein sprouty homolog 2-like [Physella acuta]|uniref:protein sprouty homolog 2-like n=1 Tax=Physella acuta TaxID=109671 RepID=UPI0027DBBB31|nr:protein sprouty homolog 2-like [Physella acuta]XP_059144690.1 protein sprouty homolog 2-like [Physella acuta]XP_059144691.1 protein sprouty homolog 2-like [Physella acuta]
MRTSLRTISQPDTFSRQVPSVITLDQTRSGPRTTNEYVDSPRAQPPLPLKPQLVTLVGVGSSSPGFAHRISHTTRGALTPTPSPVVSQQPASKSPPLKEPVNLLDGTRGGDGGANGGSALARAGLNHGEGIICEQCGKCQCESCTEPRSLPSHWCCRNTCEVSPDNVLEVCTCFCCVKCMFYHCGAEEDNPCYENPCGCCSTPHCCQRWTVMGMMSLCLPCLWTYWPAKACLAASTSCYRRCRRKGCQCNVKHDKTSVLSVGGVSGGVGSSVGGGVGIGGHSKHSQTRRLLIESDSSSA